MQKEKVRRFFDQSKKLNWDTLEKMDGKEIRGLTKLDFDPSQFLNKPTDEERRFVSNLGGSKAPGAFITPKRPIADRAKPLSMNSPANLGLKSFEFISEVRRPSNPKLEGYSAAPDMLRPSGLASPQLGHQYRGQNRYLSPATGPSRANQIFRGLQEKNGEVIRIDQMLGLALKRR